jgi:pimeloyl-ACP methyl ester carboxylesterase
MTEPDREIAASAADSSPIPLQKMVLHGHEVSFRRAGSGPSILLIHGMAGSSRTWRETMPLLARDFDVIAPDLLGHGESAKPLGDYSLGAFASGLRDLLAVLGVEHATVVGQSLGGGVAMQLAYQHPEICERLVLVGSGGLGKEVSFILRMLTLPGAELVMPFIFPSFVRDKGNDVSSFLARNGLKSPRISEMWRAYASLSAAPNRHAFLRTLRSVVDASGQTVSARDRLYLAAAMPAMLVWGDADGIIPVEHAYEAHALMPGSRLEIFENVGHFVHAEEPVRFAEVLRDFIDTTEPRHGDLEQFRELLVTTPAHFN